MKRLLYALLVGVVGAAFLHVLTALLLPSVEAERNWNRLTSALPAEQMMAVGTLLFEPDRFMRAAACRFDLSEHAVRLHADGPAAAWFLSIYDRNGEVLASATDEGAPDGVLDAVVLTPSQRAAASARMQPRLPLEVDAREVLAVIEVFVPDRTWVPASEKFLASAACTPVR